MKKQISLLSSLALVVLSMSIHADGIEPPAVMLERTSIKVISVLEEQRSVLDAEPEKIFDIVEQYIIPHLDDVTMAKLALGKHWKIANNDQKIIFVDEFRELLVRTYGKSLKEFRDLKINYFPDNFDVNAKRAVVKSEVIQPGGPIIPVAYKMRIKDNEWKVYDISIDGVSLVTSYRGTFSQEVRKGGIEGLLSMLRERNKRSKT